MYEKLLYPRHSLTKDKIKIYLDEVCTVCFFFFF